MNIYKYTEGKYRKVPTLIVRDKKKYIELKANMYDKLFWIHFCIFQNMSEKVALLYRK